MSNLASSQNEPNSSRWNGLTIVISTGPWHKLVGSDLRKSYCYRWRGYIILAHKVPAAGARVQSLVWKVWGVCSLMQIRPCQHIWDKKSGWEAGPQPLIYKETKRVINLQKASALFNSQKKHKENVWQSQTVWVGQCFMNHCVSASLSVALVNMTNQSINLTPAIWARYAWLTDLMLQPSLYRETNPAVPPHTVGAALGM